MTGAANPIIVVGSCVIDVTAYARRFPLIGETLVASSIETQVGGKASNQAIGMSRLGASPWLVVKLGQDEWAKQALALWREEGVHADYVTFHPTAGTGIGVVTVVEGGENWNLTALNANQHLLPHDIDAAAPVFQQAKVLSLHLNPPVETVLHALIRAKQAGLTTILNASPHERLDARVFALVDVVVVNRVEAFQYTGLEITDDEAATQAARVLRSQGAGHVIISLGEDGLIVGSSQAEHKLESFPVSAVDTVGAGDALIAGFAVALSEGRDLLSAARFANAAAALAVARKGTWQAMPTRTQVEDFLYEFESTKRTF